MRRMWWGSLLAIAGKIIKLQKEKEKKEKKKRSKKERKEEKKEKKEYLESIVDCNPSEHTLICTGDNLCLTRREEKE